MSTKNNHTFEGRTVRPPRPTSVGSRAIRLPTVSLSSGESGLGQGNDPAARGSEAGIDLGLEVLLQLVDDLEERIFVGGFGFGVSSFACVELVPHIPAAKANEEILLERKFLQGGMRRPDGTCHENDKDCLRSGLPPGIDHAGNTDFKRQNGRIKGPDIVDFRDIARNTRAFFQVFPEFQDEH